MDRKFKVTVFVFEPEKDKNGKPTGDRIRLRLTLATGLNWQDAKKFRNEHKGSEITLEH